jgi:hypothetical protein
MTPLTVFVAVVTVFAAEETALFAVVVTVLATCCVGVEVVVGVGVGVVVVVGGDGEGVDVTAAGVEDGAVCGADAAGAEASVCAAAT